MYVVYMIYMINITHYFLKITESVCQYFVLIRFVCLLCGNLISYHKIDKLPSVTQRFHEGYFTMIKILLTTKETRVCNKCIL